LATETNLAVGADGAHVEEARACLDFGMHGAEYIFRFSFPDYRLDRNTWYQGLFSLHGKNHAGRANAPSRFLMA
jgi:hypothetical protein